MAPRFPRNLWILGTGCGGGNKVNCNICRISRSACFVRGILAVATSGCGRTDRLRKEYPRQATALVPAEGGLIVWKPYVFSPHTGEELNVDSVPVISCTGAENCLHGQLTRYMVPNCRRNRYRKGRKGYLRTMETVGVCERSVYSYHTTGTSQYR